ncbi:MAG: hypothetical protein ACREAF_04255 [Nitrosopumilaceae archaeon]
MEIRSKKLRLEKYLLYSLVAVGLTIIISNYFGQETSNILSSVLFFIIPAALVILSLTMTIRFRVGGDHGKAWILFVPFVTSWFIAEQIWMVYDVIYNIDPWPSEADFFYIAGYPILFAFSIFYLKPLRKAISKKLVICASIIVVITLIPALEVALGTKADPFKVALATSYPVLDAIVLCPAIIGVVLFFKGEVNFLWSLICIAIIFNVVADTSFLILSIDDSYYVGHPIDILYLWAYIMFSFGVYSHLTIFRKYNTKENPYYDQEKLR